MTKVFISHASEDAPFIERRLLPLFKSNGIEAWYAKDSIHTADEWEASIRKGMEACDWFLLVMSPHSAASEWVKAEVAWAIGKRWPKIIPVLVEDCEPERFHLWIPRLQHLDFRPESDGTEAGRKLLDVEGLIDGRAGTTLVRLLEDSEAGSDVAPEPTCARDELPGGVMVEMEAAPIDLVINRDFDSYSKAEQAQLLEAIKRLLGLTDNLTVIRKRPGSVRLTVRMTPEDTERLQWAVRRGELAEFGLVDVEAAEDEGVSEEALVADTRAILTPAQMVERKLISLLKGNPLPISSLSRLRAKGEKHHD